jgi:hypothetical protein
MLLASDISMAFAGLGPHHHAKSWIAEDSFAGGSKPGHKQWAISLRDSCIELRQLSKIFPESKLLLLKGLDRT